MIGTIVNSLAIAVGGIIGLFFKNGLPDRYKDMVGYVAGLSVIVVGLTSSLGNLISGDSNLILFIISLVLGSLLGEKLDLEGKMESLGVFLETKMERTNSSGSLFPESNISNNKDKTSFSKGFVTSSILFCTGSMAILGSLESGIHGEHSILYAKSILDGVISVIFASTLGFGVIFSSVSVFIYQGTLTLLASFIAPFLTYPMLEAISIIGGVMLLALGLKLLKLIDIKVANMLPSLFIPIFYYSLFSIEFFRYLW